MFENIGAKIKGLASFITLAGIIASVASGASMISSDEDLAAIGVIIIIGGSLLSWVMSFILYGFGQLVENSDKLVSMNERKNDGVTATGDGYREKLESLGKLKADGLITEEEYQQKKNDL